MPALRHRSNQLTEIKLEGMLNEVAGIEEIEVPKAYIWQKPQCRRPTLEYICSTRDHSNKMSRNLAQEIQQHTKIAR